MTNVRLQSEGLNTSERASLYDDNAPEHAIGTMRYGSINTPPFSRPSSHTSVRAYTLGLDHGATELPTASGMQKDSGAGVLPGIPGWLVAGSS